MMNNRSIWYIALNTFRETVRDKILYLLVGFSLLVIAASLLAASVSLGQDIRVIIDFGLTAMWVFLVIITIFIGTHLVYREIEQKTIYFILSKPVSRETFYLGKYLGLLMTTTVVTVVMAVVFIVLLSLKDHSYDLTALVAIGFLLLEAWLLTAISLLFGSFTTPLASAVYTFCLALIGHSSASIWQISQKSTAVVKFLLEAVYYLFPNLEKFNFRNQVIFHLNPEPTQVLTILVYFAGYSLALLLMGLAVIRRREF